MRGMIGWKGGRIKLLQYPKLFYFSFFPFIGTFPIEITIDHADLPYLFPFDSFPIFATKIFLFIFIPPVNLFFSQKISVAGGRWSRSWHWQKSDMYYTQFLSTTIKKFKTKQKKKRSGEPQKFSHLWWSWQHFNGPIKCNWKIFTHDYKVDHSWRRRRDLYAQIPHTTKKTHKRIFHKFPPAVIILQVKEEGGGGDSNLINCFLKLILTRSTQN